MTSDSAGVRCGTAAPAVSTVALDGAAKPADGKDGGCSC